MPEFHIQILRDNKESEELERFFDSTKNVTIFHKPAFLSYHNQEKFKSLMDFSIYHFVFRDSKKKILAFIPGAVYADENGKRIYKTPFYSSYGGIVYDSGLMFEDFENIIGLFIEELSKEKINEINFTQTADCYCGSLSEKNNYISYILKQKGFTISNLDLIFVKEVNDNFEQTFHNTIQRQIRQALKNNLEFRIEDGMSVTAYELLEKSQSRLGGKPTHTFEEIQKIISLLPGKIISFNTYFNEKLIAGITGFVCNKNVLNTFYIYDDTDYRDLKGMQLTYYNVLKWINENLFKFVDFGPGTFGLKPHHSLIGYKEKFGSIPLMRVTNTLTL